jgi:hypothetical protein
VTHKTDLQDTEEVVVMLTKGFRRWAEIRAITPANFARETGYSYQYAYSLLRGSAEVRDDTMGRILRVYGCDAAAEIVKFSQAENSTVVPE